MRPLVNIAAELSSLLIVKDCVCVIHDVELIVTK